MQSLEESTARRAFPRLMRIQEREWSRFLIPTRVVKEGRVGVEVGIQEVHNKWKPLRIYINLLVANPATTPDTVGTIPNISAFNISVRTIFSWVAALRDENVSEPKRYRTPKGWIAIPPLHFDYARTALEAYPLLFLLELSEVMLFHTGIRYTVDQVRHAMKAAGYTRKVLDYQAKEQFEPPRQLFRAALSQHAAHQLLFVDETHTSPEALRRNYGTPSTIVQRA